MQLIQPVMTEVERMIRRARLNIIHKYRYFTSVAMMRIIHHPDINTMSTDGRYLYFNDQGMSTWSYEEVYAVTLHEILHCVFMHAFRRKKLKRLPFQYAADYAINIFIRDCMHLTLPEPHLYDPIYKNMSTEEIYFELIKEIPANAYTKQISGHDSGAFSSTIGQPYPTSKDFDIDPKDLSDPPLIFDDTDPDQSLPQKYQNIKTQSTVTKADILSKIVVLRGELLDPDEISLRNEALYRKNLKTLLPNPDHDNKITEYLRRILDTHNAVDRIPWYHLMQNHVRDLIFGDYGFHTPNVRYVYSGFYLPAFRVRRINKLALVIDVSGSITNRVDMLSDFFEHIRNIAEDCIIDNIEVLTCNTSIVDHFEISSSELMFHTFDIHGGGGTNLYPPLDYYEPSSSLSDSSLSSNSDSQPSDSSLPDLMIYFTDLDGEFRKEPPSFPIIWVVIEHPDQPGKFLSAPYGTEIRYIP